MRTLKSPKGSIWGPNNFLLSGERSCSSFCNPKSQMVCYFKLRINGKIDKQVVLMFSTTNEKTLRLVKDLILNKNPKSY